MAKAASRLFAAQVVHTRYKPVHNSFNYPVYYYAFDLDELQTLSDRLYMFGYNRMRPVSIWDEDYVVSAHAPEPLKKIIDPKWSIKKKLIAYLSEHGMETEKIARIELITGARYFGKAFNPVSFYFCYSVANTLETFVAEVNNTFGERHIYVLPAKSALELDSASSSVYSARFMTNKIFHVSPFNDVSGLYEFKISDLTKRIQVNINQMETESTRVMATYLIGQAPYYEMSDYNLVKMLAKYPVTALLTFPRITIEAFKLHYKLHMRVYAKPPPQSSDTIGLIEATWAQAYAQSKILPALESILGRSVLQLPNQTSIALNGPSVTQKPLEIRVLSWDLCCVLHERGSSLSFLLEAFVSGYVECSDLCELIRRFRSIPSKFDGREKFWEVPQIGYVPPIPVAEAPRPPPFLNTSAVSFNASHLTMDSFGLNKASQILFLANSTSILDALQLVAATNARCTIICSGVDVSSISYRAKELSISSNIATLTYEAIFGTSKTLKAPREYEIFGETPFSHVVALDETWQCLVGAFGSGALKRFLKVNTKTSSKILLDLTIKNTEEVGSKPVQGSRSWSPFGWVSSLHYSWDKMKQHFSGELLDVITTYVVNPFQVDVRTKDIYFIHGFCNPEKDLGSPNASRVGITELNRVDISTDVSSKLETELKGIQSWWLALKALNLPLSSPEYRWSVEELRAVIFNRISSLIRLHNMEVKCMRVIFEKA
eukprot:TRINITY_DN11985_c0_g1_i1.p1 TRINITY_DN11985_c0_g1~~TRINITY_DN11985_c0_g1_i1.p1  ORF type:complete len:734 (-),score=82.57 TRINITY_DN11985_c0_g1_i1:174-2324(-)